MTCFGYTTYLVVHCLCFIKLHIAHHIIEADFFYYYSALWLSRVSCILACMQPEFLQSSLLIEYNANAPRSQQMYLGFCLPQRKPGWSSSFLTSQVSAIVLNLGVKLNMGIHFHCLSLCVSLFFQINLMLCLCVCVLAHVKGIL